MCSHLFSLSLSFLQLTTEWLMDPGYQSWQICTGFAIGVVSAALCLLVLITIGICKQFFSRIRSIFKFNHFLKEVVPPTIGGVIIGERALICPRHWSHITAQALSIGRCRPPSATAT